MLYGNVLAKKNTYRHNSIISFMGDVVKKKAKNPDSKKSGDNINKELFNIIDKAVK